MQIFKRILVGLDTEFYDDFASLGWGFDVVDLTKVMQARFPAVF
jgi:hypothetical protein